MPLNQVHLITRRPIIDRNREVAFCRLAMAENEHDVAMPFMLRLANIETPQMVYFLPLAWMEDAVVLKKLSKDMVLTAEASALDQDIAIQARELGFRFATAPETENPDQPDGNFRLVPLAAGTRPSPDTVITGVETTIDFEQAKARTAMYFSGGFFMDCLPKAAARGSIHPSHMVVLELMAAVQKEAEPKDLEILVKRDVTLSFKLLRYINSPYFGLAQRVESIRHAVSILGYQQLFKWLALLAVTAGGGAAPALTHAAMARAKLMELLGSKGMDRKDQDNLFVTGMFSLLDRIMGIPLEQVLVHVNLPESISEALLAGTGKYHRFLGLALACEGGALPEQESYVDLDAKTVNIAHLEAIEWATQISKAGKA